MENGNSRAQEKGKTLKDHHENKEESGTNAFHIFLFNLKKKC
jgi:hypothetical protein